MKEAKSMPSISIVIATYNSMRTIRRCLESIQNQKYPKDRIEVIVADGSSKDETPEVARAFGAQVHTISPKSQNAEYNKSIGIKHAKNEILAMIDHDNVLPHPDWLTHMVKPFMDDERIVGVETLRYAYDPSESLLDRYFALFGTGDPFVWYLRRADRLSYMYDAYTLRGNIIEKTDTYYIVRFHEHDMPTVGANGFLVRRMTLMKHAHAQPGEYFDMDVNVDLIRRGFDTFAFVDDAILHLTGYGNIWRYLQRRMLFMSQYHVGEAAAKRKRVRRYEIYTKYEIWRLVAVILICLTIVIPIYDSFRGWLRVRDRAWFLHPVMAVGFVFTYAWVIIEHRYRSYAATILGK